ncbi:uncharacterized protein BO97DRAFT_395848 [Aspergillus homomorphus CBS 101889]|uniref:CoA-dependent acyltransferase n=1 Tax=Aspergillus homomorphus (strain CBS 101889) TaxID=1450537 RepID=A0A395HPN6_ASPHC|nr:hypothetical protein BO97DRAFT_395848 [Aspergillus homomorphus CBS 101889]RAL09586.1 hypothetical protein BO97DRAFT_395848 [Aspergillus homomorphus CBS 101889]
MVWNRTNGVWHDDLDGAEKVFYDMSQAFQPVGKEHGSVYTVCKIRMLEDQRPQHPLEVRLRDAWISLRIEFPSLSVVVSDAQRKEYMSANPQRLQHWASETFWVDDSGNSAIQVVSSLHLRKFPCLIFLPRTSELVFHSSHWRIDALGACMLLDRLFEKLSRDTDTISVNEDDNMSPNLSPSLEDAFGSPAAPTPQMEAVAKCVQRRNFQTSYPTAGLPVAMGARASPPARSSPQALALTREATEALLAACKRHAISVTAAVHAACAQAVFDRWDSFTTRAGQLTKAYRGGDWDVSEYMAALRPIYRVHGETLRALATPHTRAPATNITVSSLGVIDKYLTRKHGAGVLVEQFHLGSAIMNRQMTLYIWTFDGQLTLSLDSNEAYYPPEIVRGILGSICACLEKELNLNTVLMRA